MNTYIYIDVLWGSSSQVVLDSIRRERCERASATGPTRSGQIWSRSAERKAQHVNRWNEVFLYDGETEDRDAAYVHQQLRLFFGPRTSLFGEQLGEATIQVSSTNLTTPTREKEPRRPHRNAIDESHDARWKEVGS